MARRKVLCIAGWYPNINNPTEGIFIQEHIRAIARLHDVVVIYRDYNPSDTQISDSVEDGIRTIRYHKRSWIPKQLSYLIFSLQIKSIVKKLLTDKGWHPDIIHAHGYIASLPAVQLKKQLKIPVVASEHSSTFPLKQLTLLERLIARYGLTRCDLLLPVSQQVQKGFTSYDIHTKSEIIPNVVDTNMFTVTDSRSDDGTIRLLCVARLIPQKGTSLILRALPNIISKHPDVIFDIIGDGPVRSRLEKLARYLHIEKNIRFLGAMPKNKIAEHMKHCSFYVQASTFETFGITYLEALACGKPVIAPVIDPLIANIGEGRGLFFSPNDISDLTGAIKKMIETHTSYLSEELSTYVEKNFSANVVAKKITEVYDSVIGDQKNRSKD